MTILYKRYPRGRAGNSLFQYAFIRSLALRLGADWALPDWAGKRFFLMGKNWKIDDNIKPTNQIREVGFDFDEKMINPRYYDPTKNINITGYFQTEKYFEDVWDEIKNDFRFEEAFLQRCVKSFGFTPGNLDVAVHVRRKDYVNNSNYINIPAQYYLSYFVEHPELTFYVFSDDYNYCRFHFSAMPNVKFIDDNSAIWHLALMSQFKNIMVANSSFSWWGAKISEIYHGNIKVVRPDCLFDGKLLAKSDGRDFYPDRWHKRNLESKIDLSNVTFLIPVKMDSSQRKNNLELAVCMIQKSFIADIIIGEQGGTDFEYMGEYATYHHFKDMRIFHRTKMLNEMTKMASTPIVINFDADVMIPPAQIYAAVEMIRSGQSDFVYPYEKFAHVPRKPYRRELQKNLDLGILAPIYFKGMEEDARTSYGGAVVLNKDKFIQAGMENENFKSWGREDYERVHRFRTLGYNVGRVDGNLYHLDHVKSEDSTRMHAFYRANNEEYFKVRAMTVKELQNYIETWQWRKDALNLK